MAFHVGLFVGLTIGAFELSFASDNPKYTHPLSFVTASASIAIAVYVAAAL